MPALRRLAALGFASALAIVLAAAASPQLFARTFHLAHRAGASPAFDATYTPQANDSSQTVPANMSEAAFITVRNNGNTQGTFTFTFSCSGAATSCGAGIYGTSLTINPGVTYNYPVAFHAGAIGSSGQVQVIMTAPARANGLIEKDTAVLALNFQDLNAPGLLMTPLAGIDPQTGYPEEIVLTHRDTTVTLDACDTDGSVSTPQLFLNGAGVNPTTVSNSSTACGAANTAKHVVFTLLLPPGYSSVYATATDGVHTTTTAEQPYTYDDSHDHLPAVVAVHTNPQERRNQTVTDTFVVTNPGWNTVVYSLAGTCTYSWTSGCGTTLSANSVTLAGGTSARIAATFQTGPNVNYSTYVTLTATFHGAIQTVSSAATMQAKTAAITAPVVTVTPGSGTTYTSSTTGQIRIDWCDEDDNLTQHTATWQGQALTANYTSTTAQGCHTAGYSIYTHLSLNPWQQYLVATAKDQANHITTDSVKFIYSIPLSSYAPSVTVPADWHRLPHASMTAADTFTVTNVGSLTAAYALTPLCGGAATLSSCSANPSSVSLAAGAAATTIVTYTRSGATDATDTLKLAAAYTSPTGGVIADTGKRVVVSPSVEATPVVSSSSAADTMMIPSAWSFVVVSFPFTITNTSSVPITYAVIGSATNGYQVNDYIGHQAPFDPWYISVGPGQSGTVFINFRSPTGDGVTGALTATATYVNSSGVTVSGSGSYTNVITLHGTPGPTPNLSITGANLSMQAGSTRPATFFVTNNGTAAVAVNYGKNCPTGGAIASCANPDHTTKTISAGHADTVNVSVTAAATAGLTGTATLQVTSGTYSTSGSVTVTTGFGSGAISIAATNLINPGSSITRDACLTIAAGSGAAYECGDLRLVHPLPTTTTMNKARTPTLIYTSGYASPMALVATDVTIDGTICPSQVNVYVVFPARNDSVLKSVTWNGPCGQLAARRIVVPVDIQAHSLSTGVYPITVHAGTTVGGLPYAASDNTGLLAVVNRASASSSSFGIGWWLDGLESLYSVPGRADQRFWVGGDGSTRLYTLLPGTAMFTVQPTVERVDTLEGIPDGVGGYAGYRRHLRNSAVVQFDGFMRHVATINSVGHTTQFFYDTTVPSQLDSLVLPVPDSTNASARRTYLFGYTSGLLTSVTAPAGQNGARVVTLARSGSVLTITDPGAPGVQYSSDTHNRVTVRTNRLGDGTRFDYDPTASLLTHVGVDMTRTTGSADSIRTTFCPAEAVTVASCATGLADPNQVHTVYDGPRTDVADITSFHLTRFGAPNGIVDALNDSTTIEFTDSKWPLLATAVVQPNGHRVEAFYNSARGLVDSTRDVNPLGDSQDPLTRYTWDNLYDKVTQVRAPTGEPTNIHYLSNGDRDYQEDGRGSLSRVNFTYAGGTRLLATIQPAGNTTSQVYLIQYDSVLGNVQHETTPKGFMTEHFRDALGRDTLVKTPTDASQTDALKRWTRSVFDNRDRLHVASDSARVSGGTSDVLKLTVTTEFDDDDKATLITRQVSPDPAAISTVVLQSVYDAAGRKTSESDPVRGQTTGRWTYDPAGNVTAAIRGDDPVGVTMEYDAANRLTHRVVPNGVANSPTTTPATTLRDDDQHFFYNNVGNLTSVTNYAARIGRSYFPNGSLATDTLRIATADLTESDATRFSQHVYAVGYRYDPSGRRQTMTPPSGLGLGQVTYSYDPAFGALHSITDPTFGTFAYGYSAAALMDTLTSPDGTRDLHTFDIDSRETDRSETNPVSGTLHSEAAGMDARGKRVSFSSSSVITGTGASETYTYDGLGGVIATTGRTTEFTPRDALGNALYRSRSSEPFQENYAYVAHTTRLWQITQRLSSTDLTSDTTQQTFSAASGDLLHVLDQVKGPVLCADGDPSCGISTNTYNRLVAQSDITNQYDAAGRLVYTVKVTSNDQSGLWQALGHDVNDVSVYPKFERGVTEEYRYDGLGRRVWVRALRNPYCPGAHDRDSTSVCVSSVERSIYDGDQVIAEIRQPGDDTISVAVLESDGIAASASRRYFGIVSYLHGPGIDHPIAITRNFDGSALPVVTHYHGLYGIDGATQLNGALLSPCTGGVSCYDDGLGNQPDFAGRRMTYGFVISSPSLGPVSWWGSVANDKQNATGTLDMRNRVYDSRTGRFTQEDPIGLAGGMNLYGFAGGDPVNFNDPFGLWPWPELAGAGGAVLSGGGSLLGGLSLGGPAGWIAIGGVALAGTLDHLAGVIGEPRLSMRAGADATSVVFERRSGRSLKGEWEGLHGQPWPEGCVAHHICPLADGGKDDATNIEPKTPEDHVQGHKDNGDFKRWGARSKQDPPKREPEPPQP